LKRFSSILFIITSLNFFGQDSVLTSKFIVDLKRIDSLYRQIPKFDQTVFRVYYATYRLNFVYPSPDTLITPRHISLNLSDSIKLKKYCNDVNINYHTVICLFKLLIEYKYTGVNSDGIKDCSGCSTMIFFAPSDYYIVKNIKHPCFQNACFNEQTKDRNTSKWTITELTTDISVVKKRR